MSVHRHSWSLALLLMIGTGAVFAASALVFAEDTAHIDHARHVHTGEATVPTMPGQQAFGTIQEIVQILEADPATDWSKVNIGALREHLIDMDEVTMRARASERAIDNGIEITVTGAGRTLDAIKRMVPAHAHELAALGWSAKTQELPNGVKLVVTGERSAPSRKDQGPRIHRHHGAGRASPNPSFDDGERRVHALKRLMWTYSNSMPGMPPLGTGLSPHPEWIIAPALATDSAAQDATALSWYSNSKRRDYVWCCWLASWSTTG